MNNKTIAQLLKSAVENSKCKQEVWGDLMLSHVTKQLLMVRN